MSELSNGDLRKINANKITDVALHEWCDVCVHAIDGRVDPTTEFSVASDNIAAMGALDWTAFMLASVVVSLTTIGELRDIELCSIAIDQADEVLPTAWKRVFRLIGGFRRWAFLPSLLSCVVVLVMVLGGDALSVCFNTVAILFLCELDNIGYSAGLSEVARCKFEECGRVQLKDRQAADMWRSKSAHLWLFMSSLASALLIIVAVDPAKMTSENMFAAVMLPRAAFLFGGWYDSYVRLEESSSVAEIFKGIARVAVASGLGLAVWNLQLQLID